MIINEREVKVLVNSEGGNALIKELIRMNYVESFNFGDSFSQTLEDIYLDYDDLMFKNNNSYLRMRGREDLHLITFRKEIIKHDSIIVDEITHPLSDEGLKVILEKLKDFNFVKSKPVLFKPTFIEVFQTIGISEKLRVNINRIKRELFVEDIKIGEIKIDKFSYHPKSDVYYVIEIDTYKKAYHLSIDKLVDILHSKYGYRVEFVHKNKYERGIELLSTT